MGIMTDIIKQLAQKGEFSTNVTVGDTTFVLGVLDNEESILADSLIDMDDLHERLAGKKGTELKSYTTTIDSVRTVTRLALIIRSVNGISPVNNEGTLEERITSIKDFRDDLLILDPAITDQLNVKYNELLQKRSDFFSDSTDIAKK